MTFLISASGSDDLNPSAGWGDVPEADRARWSRYMLDYTPWFPGITMMGSFVAPGILAGGSGAPKQWKEHARDLHELGYTPTDYYLFSQQLELRLVTGRLLEMEHRRYFAKWGTGNPRWGFIMQSDAAKVWLGHLRAGRSPRRAMDYTLTDGNPPPMGRTPNYTRSIGD